MIFLRIYVYAFRYLFGKRKLDNPVILLFRAIYMYILEIS